MVRKYLRLRWLRVFGAPVYVHWSALVVSAVLLFMSLESPVVALETVACYLAVIFLHEIGHGWFAQRRGLEVIAIRIGFFHGSCEYEAPEYRRDEYVVDSMEKRPGACFRPDPAVRAQTFDGDVGCES